MSKHILLWFLAFTGHYMICAQTIISTKHNLSVSGPGTIKASSEQEVCIFCHTPHNSKPQGPLWNRNNPGVTYTLYSSSTLNALPGQPDGSSILCLSCHDGTIALGSVVSRPAIDMNGVTVMPTGNKNLTTDLSNDHPISFTYNSSLSLADGQLKDPNSISSPVKLENNKVQCISCHDPHTDVYTNFLVATSKASALCLSCHNRTYWTASTHNSSTSTWNGSGTNPWFHTPYTTVADNACENCHNPHNATGKTRLMKYTQEENNCLDCHNGNVAVKKIDVEFAKTYRHDVFAYTNLHDPVENAFVTTKHVECSDCHNPHAVNNTTAVAPFRKGNEIGVSGIDQSGNPVSSVTYSYEICYKCHSGNSWAPVSPTARLVPQNNIRLQFATTNASFHPVAGPRNNTEITSNLLSPNTASTVLYCTACHASNGTGSPAGPHGSIYPRIMKMQYITTDGGTTATGTTESAAAYELCYSCHNRTRLLSGTSSFPLHNLHVVSQRTPCNTCHEPHGISSPGNSTNNSNLINFNTAVVKASENNGGPLFVDQGLRKGSCYVMCHGQDHPPKSY